MTKYSNRFLKSSETNMSYPTVFCNLDFPWTHRNVNLMNLDIFIVSATWNAFYKIVVTVIVCYLYLHLHRGRRDDERMSVWYGSYA